MRILGNPNLMSTCSNRKCVVVYALQYLTGVASTHIERYSITVMMYHAPDLLMGG